MSRSPLEASLSRVKSSILTPHFSSPKLATQHVGHSWSAGAFGRVDDEDQDGEVYASLSRRSPRRAVRPPSGVPVVAVLHDPRPREDRGGTGDIRLDRRPELLRAASRSGSTSRIGAAGGSPILGPFSPHRGHGSALFSSRRVRRHSGRVSGPLPGRPFPRWAPGDSETHQRDPRLLHPALAPGRSRCRARGLNEATHQTDEACVLGGLWPQPTDWPPRHRDTQLETVPFPNSNSLRLCTTNVQFLPFLSR